MRLTRLFFVLAFLFCHGSCAPVDPPDPPSKKPEAEGGNKAPAPEQQRVEAPSGLEVRIRAALDHVGRRELLTSHGFWTVGHGILGLGMDVELKDPMTGKKVKAMDLICNGGPIRGMEFIPTGYGLDVQMGPMFVGQGHQDQFIAEMAQQGMPLDRKIRWLGKEYTFADFVNHAKMRVRVSADQELSWTVVVIGQYYGVDASWVNGFGEVLTLEDLVRYELAQPIDSAACGGTHRLFGLTWVYHLHQRRGGKTEGVWKEVAEKIAEYQNKAHQYQNGDGSFSDKYLAGPGFTHDSERRINTTGHVLEWLALSLSDEQLREPWMQNAASALALMILESQGRPVDGGSIYHAAHGLHLYQARVFGPDKGKGLGVPLPGKGAKPESLPAPLPEVIPEVLPGK
jgi:hypothetical protein